MSAREHVPLPDEARVEQVSERDCLALGVALALQKVRLPRRLVHGWDGPDLECPLREEARPVLDRGRRPLRSVVQGARDGDVLVVVAADGTGLLLLERAVG